MDPSQQGVPIGCRSPRQRGPYSTPINSLWTWGNAIQSSVLTEIARLRLAGADSAILGCTEIGMLLSQADLDLPVFDTTRLHAEAAMGFALGAAPAQAAANPGQ